LTGGELVYFEMDPVSNTVDRQQYNINLFIDKLLLKFNLLSLFMYLFPLIQTGQLNEYTERREMQADVVSMALGSVPAGEQRTRFLAVGLADSTVRIISLDPTVSFTLLISYLNCTSAI